MSAVMVESDTRYPGAPVPPADLSRIAAIRLLAGVPDAIVASLTEGQALKLQLLTELVAVAFATGQIEALRAVRR